MPGPFTTLLTVRFGDVDPVGIVYYPRFLHYCHVAMEAFFAEVVDLDYARLVDEHRLGLPTVRAEIDFRRPLRYGDRVAIEVAVERLGETSVTWRFRLLREIDAAVAAEARVVTVHSDIDELVKRPIPCWLRDRLAAGSTES